MTTQCENNLTEKKIRFIVTGSAAHDRIAPLLPSHWIDCTSTYGRTNYHPTNLDIDKKDHCNDSDSNEIDFLWENTPRIYTRKFRDDVKCYSHLPNGTAILDSKWVLARLMEYWRDNDCDYENTHLATLETHCFRGLSGFQNFADIVGLSTTSSTAAGGDDGHENDNDPINTDENDKSKKKTEISHIPPSYSNDMIPKSEAIFDLDEKSNELYQNHLMTSSKKNVTSSPQNLWVVKDANSNGAGGIWIVSPINYNIFLNSSDSINTKNIRKNYNETVSFDLSNTSPLSKKSRFVAQKYAWPLVLYQQKKCHIRVYALMTSDGKAYVHRRAFLHVANDNFDFDSLSPSSSSSSSSSSSQPITKKENHNKISDAQGTYYNYDPTVHITNCCANSHDSNKFLGEICADLYPLSSSDDRHVHNKKKETNESNERINISLLPFFPSICASIHALAKSSFPLLQGGEGHSGFEYLGLDFILSYTTPTKSSPMRSLLPIAYLLEVNAPPSQDTATGLPHAEKLHDEVISDLLTLWVYPRVCGQNVIPGGWKCVYDDKNEKKMNKSSVEHSDDSKVQLYQEKTTVSKKNSNTKSSLQPIKPSKAAILNQVRWAMYEHKCLKSIDGSRQISGIKNETMGKSTTLRNASKNIIEHNQIKKESRATADQISRYARSQFPYFDKNNMNVNEASSSTISIFLENAGGAQVPSNVIQAMNESLSYRHREKIGTKSKAHARQTLLALLGANDDFEHAIFLGANASSLLTILSQKYIHSNLLSDQDEIVIAEHNHEANISPWLEVARVTGAKVKWWKSNIEPTHHVNKKRADVNKIDPPMTKSTRTSLVEKKALDNLNQVLTRSTKIVAMAHTSNVLGQLYDIQSIAKHIHCITFGKAKVVVDGVASVPHRYADLKKSGVDWYVISCHKLFGPHLGALCGKKDAIDEIQKCKEKKQVQQMLHNEDGHDVTNSNESKIFVDRDCYEKIYKEWEVGTMNYEACAGVGFGLGHYFHRLARISVLPIQISSQCSSQLDISDVLHNDSKERCMDQIIVSGAHPFSVITNQEVIEAYRNIKIAECPLIKLMMDCLLDSHHVQILQHSKDASILDRLPIICFVHDQIKSSEIVQYCKKHNIIARHGTFLSSYILSASNAKLNALKQRSMQGTKEEGVVRFSMAHYNTLDEIQYVMNVLESMSKWK